MWEYIHCNIWEYHVSECSEIHDTTTTIHTVRPVNWIIKCYPPFNKSVLLLRLSLKNLERRRNLSIQFIVYRLITSTLFEPFIPKFGLILIFSGYLIEVNIQAQLQKEKVKNSSNMNVGSIIEATALKLKPIKNLFIYISAICKLSFIV